MSKKLKIIATRGLPASGKTTWANEQMSVFPEKRYIRVNRDDIRKLLHNDEFTNSNEKLTRRARNRLIRLGIESDRNVIVDDTNLVPSTMASLKELAEELKVTFEVMDFTDVSLEECIDRDQKRQNPVGKKVIMRMYNDFLKEDVTPNWYKSESKLPSCIICDLDGTLSLFKGDWIPKENQRSPYDWMRCANDLGNEPIKWLLHVAFVGEHQYSDLKIILLSGREDSAKAETIKFLKNNFVHYNELHMRKAGDSRDDRIVKQELYEAHIKDKYFVRFVLDDRDRVVNLWRDLGLTCLQVAPGDF